MKRFLLILPLLLVLLSNLPSSAQAEAAGPDIFGGNEELKKLFSRELSAIEGEPLTLTAPDSFFVTKAKSSEQPEIIFNEKKGFYTFKLSIGTNQPIECLVFKDRKDLATISRTIINNRMKQSGRIENWAIRKVASGLTQTHPYYYLQVVYRAKTEKGYLLGELEYFAVGHLGGTVILTHDEPGYNQTFFNFALDMSASTTINNNSPTITQPDERRVYLGKLGNQPIGFIEQLDYHYQDKGDMTMVVSSTLLPSGDGKITSKDDVSVVRSRPQGDVTQQSHFSMADDIRIMEIALNKTGDKTYQVKGKLQGKEIESQFETAVPIPGGTWIEAIVKKEILSKRQKTLSFPQYIPDINPMGQTEATLTSMEEKTVQFSMGPIVQILDLDDNAVPQKISISLGVNSLVYQLAWSSSQNNNDQ